MNAGKLLRTSHPLFVTGVTLSVVSIITNLFISIWAMFPWMVGLALCTFGMAWLYQGLGKENTKPEYADEYQRTLIDKGRSAALKTASIFLGAIMFILLFIPLLILTPIDTMGLAEVARSVGMLAGLGILAVSYVQAHSIAKAMHSNELADQAA